MVAAVPVRPLVSRRELAAAEDLIRLSLRLEGERGIDLAAVDQERRICLVAILLHVWTQPLSSHLILVTD